MTFRELLEKYKDGTATEAERALVEAELEKSEAIADYLAEGLEERLEAAGAGPCPTEETKKVKRTVERKLRRTALWGAGIVLAVVLAVWFVVEPVVSSFHYQPNAQTVGQDEERPDGWNQDQDDVMVDLTAFCELMAPGQAPVDVQTEDEGFGRYTVTYGLLDGLTGETAPVTQHLRPARYGRAVERIWGDYSLSLLEMTIPEEGAKTEDLEYLAKMPETFFLSAWVHFPEDLNPIKFAKLEEEYDLAYSGACSFRWAGVRVSEQNLLRNDGPMFLGFATKEASRVQVSPSWAAYPMFDYSQHAAEGGRTAFGSNYYMHVGSLYKTHFQSMLAYAADRPQAVEALVGPIQEGVLWDMSAAQGYVEENGVRISGALVYGEPEALLRMWEQGQIDNISIQEVLPSRYSGSRDIRQ